MRKSLLSFSHFFVQDKQSKQLLNSIHFSNVSVSGDTRFDRVTSITTQDNTLDFLEKFKEDNLLVVIGSSWKEDEDVLVKYINENGQNVKFVIAPHNVHDVEIERLQKSIQQPTVLYSDKEKADLKEAKVFTARHRTENAVINVSAF